MHLIHAAGAPVVCTLGQKTWTLPRMTVRDWALMAAQLASDHQQILPQWRSALRETATSNDASLAHPRPAGLGLLQSRELEAQQLLQSPPTLLELWQYAHTPQGAMHVLRISASHVSAADDLDRALRLTCPFTLLRLASRVGSWHTPPAQFTLHPEKYFENADMLTLFTTLRRWLNIDPLELTMDQMMGYLDRVSEITSARSGRIDHRAHLQRMKQKQAEASYA